MNKPIKIPSLPFASSIVGGEQHAGVRPANHTVFNLKYFAGLYKIHQNDIPQLLSDKLSMELYAYVEIIHNDLATVMFERLISLETNGVLCAPVKEEKRILTMAYHFSSSSDTMDVVVSVADYSKGEAVDEPVLAFTAEIIDGTNDIGISMPSDVSVPLMFWDGHSLEDLNDRAWYVVKLICAFEAMFAYHCIKFKNLMYDAMLEKDGVRLNPNFVQVNLLTLNDEEKPSI